jgi:hypothetical protein
MSGWSDDDDDVVDFGSGCAVLDFHLAVRTG